MALAKSIGHRERLECTDRRIEVFACQLKVLLPSLKLPQEGVCVGDNNLFPDRITHFQGFEQLLA